MGERRGANRVLDDKPEGKSPLGRPRCRWDDNIKMGWEPCSELIWLRIRTGGGLV
jgi:hypothetical protein